MSGRWLLVVMVSSLAGRAGAETVVAFDATANVLSTAVSPAYDVEYAMEFRPGLLLQFGSPQLVWRARYLLASTMTNGGESGYSHFADLTLASEPTRRTAVTLGVSVTQGGAAFRISQPAADAGRPDFLDPEAPDLVTGTARQTFSWEVTPTLRLGQEFHGSWTAAPAALDDPNSSASGLLRLDWLFESNALGASVGATYSRLRPMDLPVRLPHLQSWIASFLASWSRDFDERWSGEVAGGVQLVKIIEPSSATWSPSGRLTIRYSAGAGEASFSAIHAVLPRVETGTLSQTDELVLRGTWALDRDRRGVLSGSAGLLQTRPRRDAGLLEQPNNALRGDASLAWSFSPLVQATARYSVAHQFWLGETSTVHVLLAGITIRFSNTDVVPPIPSPGQRVDGSDAVRFQPEPRRP